MQQETNCDANLTKLQKNQFKTIVTAGCFTKKKVDILQFRNEYFVLFKCTRTKRFYHQVLLYVVVIFLFVIVRNKSLRKTRATPKAHNNAFGMLVCMKYVIIGQHNRLAFEIQLQCSGKLSFVSGNLKCLFIYF